MRHIKWSFLFGVLFLTACGDSEVSENSQQPAAKETTTVSSEEAQQAQAADSAFDSSKLSAGAFQVLNISEGVYDQTTTLQINVNHPLDRKQNWSQLIRVTEAGNNLSASWIVADNGLALYYPFIKTNTDYQIHVSQSLRNQQGKMLTQSYDKGFKTTAAEKTARFISQGNTLLSSDNALPVEAVNVEAVTLKFWRIHKNQLHDFLQYPNKQSIYELQQLSKIADLIYTGRYQLDMTANKTENHQIPLDNIAELKSSGVYFVTMMAADQYDYDYATTWFVRTDIALHSRQYRKDFAVFVQKLPAAKPYAQVKVTAYDKNNLVLVEAQTDKSGFALMDLNGNKPSYLLAEQDDNIQLLALNQPKLDLSEFAIEGRPYRSQELFLYGPRDLYRPGETVRIDGILRDADGRRITPAPVAVTVKRPDNRVVRNFDWQGDDSGYYTTEFTLPDDALTGRWQFQAKLGNNDLFAFDIFVEDFLPERLALKLKPETTAISSDQAAVINLQSDYLYGAPAAGNRFDATITMDTAEQLFKDFEGYHFGSNHYTELSETFTVDPANLDANGQGVLTIPARWQKTQFPLKLKTHVNVYEAGGRPLSRNTVQTIWPYTQAVGVKPLWEGRFADPNKTNEVALIAVNNAGEQITMDTTRVVLVQENTDRYWHWGDDGWAYRDHANERTIYSAVTPLTADSPTQLQLPIQYGQYRLEIYNEEEVLLSSYRFFAGWHWYDANNAEAEKPDQVKLAWQADAVVPGEEASLNITAPFAGTALITVESDELLWHQVIEFADPQTTINIPIDQQWQRHDIYVSVMVVKAGAPKRKHLPQRALGIIHLPLERSQQQLDVVLEHPKKTLPDEPLTVKISAKNALAATYVTVAAVDTGVLSVSNFKTPEPFTWFFTAREYLPALWDMYGRLIAMIDANKAVQKFGGDADINRGGEQPQSDVQIVSLMTEKVTLDSQGNGQVQFNLPYFNGELRLMAVAFNAQQVGSTDSTVKVAAAIVIEASLPRFMAKQDHSNATLEVHNTQDSMVELELTVTADAVLGGEKLNRRLILAADEKQVFKLPLIAMQHSGMGQLQVQAKTIDGEPFNMDRVWKLGLRAARPAVTEKHHAIVNQGKEITIDAKYYDGFQTQNLKSVLTLSNQIVLAEQQHLQQLLQYPYGCLEQTTSRAWPMLLADKKDFILYENTEQSKLFNERHEIMQQAIGRIIGMQLYNGGFGYWSNDSDEAYWLTAFATDFLLRAENMGYKVPPSALQKAVERLQYYVQNRVSLGADLSQYLSSSHHYETAYKAYAAYVLATAKQVSLADVRNLYDNLGSSYKSPLPLAHLAVALETLGDEKRATLAWQAVTDFKWQQESHAYYGDYGSKIRDLAAVVELGVQSPLLENLPQSVLPLLNEVKEELQKRRWLSTQERGILFRTAKQLAQKADVAGDWQAELTRLDETTEIIRQDDLVNVYLEDDAKQPIILKNTGNQPVYANWTYQGYLEKPEATSNGIEVRKHYYDLQGKSLNLKEVTTGDMVLVRVTVTADKVYGYLPDAMLVDLLPAGFEPENQNLDNAMQLDDIKIDGKSIAEWTVNNQLRHQEYRDDRYVAAFALSSYQPTNLIYLVRAVTPGTFTVPQALVEDMYRPEVRGLSADAGQLIVKPVQP